MTIAIKKIELAKRLFDEEDETIINEIESLLNKKTRDAKNTKVTIKKDREEERTKNNELVEKYGRKYTDVVDFDLEKVKKEQNYQGYNPDKFEKHAKKLNITESLEELLAMLD